MLFLNSMLREAISESNKITKLLLTNCLDRNYIDLLIYDLILTFFSKISLLINIIRRNYTVMTVRSLSHPTFENHEEFIAMNFDYETKSVFNFKGIKYFWMD